MRLRNFVTIKISLTLVLLASMLYPLAQPSEASAASAASASSAGSFKSLTGILQPIIDAAAEDGVGVSIGVEDLSGTYGNDRIELGSPDAYLAASTIKLAIVTALMQEIEAGRLSLEQKVTVTSDVVVGGTGSLKNDTFPEDVAIERLARLMITQSDNTATNVLIDLLGFGRVKELIDSLGFKVMQLGRKMISPANPPKEENYVNTSELLTLLDKIYNAEVVSPESRDQILTWMKAQEVNTKFGAALPGKPIAHKTGELGDVSHDVGYFLIPGKEIAITVLTKVLKPEDSGKAQELGNPIVQRVAKAVYNFLMDEPRAAASPATWPTVYLSVEPIVKAAEKAGIRVAVGIKDESGKSERELLLGSGQPFAPASTIKMALVSTLMKQVDEGTLSLDQTVTVEQDDVVGGTGSLQKDPSFPEDVTLERLARLMITQSDNTATNVLIDVVGLDNVQSLMDELGLKVMHLGRKMFAAAPTPEQDNYIDAADFIALLDKIYKGEFLSDQSRDQIIDWMKAQEVNTKFGAALPGKPIAHKTGENANVTHDAGYFLIPGSEIAIAVLTEVTTTGDFDKAQEIGNPIVQSIAKAVYGALSYEPGFTDVPAGYWAAPYIEAASAAELIAGTSETTFGPNAPVTRAELVSMLSRSLGLVPPNDGTAFADMPADSAYAADIAAAKAAGIVEGRPDGTFGAADSVSRAELAALLARAYEYANGPVPARSEELPFTDAGDIAQWAEQAVLKCRQLGIIDGYEDGTFRPDSPATRAEAAKSIVFGA